MTLDPVSQGEFLLNADTRLRFTIDGSGQVTAVHALDQEGQVLTFA